MPISHIASSVAAIASEEDLTVPAPAGILDDDFLGGFYIHGDNDVAPVAMSGFSQVEEYADSLGTTDTTLAIFRKIAASESGSYLMDATTPSPDTPVHSAGIVPCFRGVDTANPLDVAYVRASHYQKLSNPAADITPKTITTATAGAWVLVYVYVAGNSLTAFVAPSGYTKIAENFDGQRNVALFYKEIATAGLESPGAVGLTGLDAADETLSVTLALKPATAGSTPTIEGVGPDDLDSIFDNELRVDIDGAGFEAVKGTGKVELHDTDPLTTTPGTTVLQTTRTWSDTLINFDVDLGALVAGSVWLSVTNDSGGEMSKQITVAADPGAAAVGRRLASETVVVSLGTPMSLDAAARFFASDVQDALSFVAANLPAGLSLSGGVISGIVSLGAAGASPYAVTVDCDDVDGNAAPQDAFTFTITTASPVVLPLSRRTRFHPLRTQVFGGF